MTNYNFKNNKHLIILFVAMPALGLMSAIAQTKPNNKVYFVPFTEAQYLALYKRSMHADSLLQGSSALSKEVSPARNLIQELTGVFATAYMRNDTLMVTPLKKQEEKKTN